MARCSATVALGATILSNYLEVEHLASAEDDGRRRLRVGIARRETLLECGVLAVALEMVRVQRLLHMHPTGPEFESDARRLEGVLLRVVAAALAKSPSARHALRGAGGVEVLVEGVGAVSTDAKNAVAAGAGLAFDGGWGAPGSWDDPAAAERLHLQLAALDAIRLAVARNARNARLAADAGAFGERLAALLRRCATESAARTMREMQDGMDENATEAGAGAAGTRDAASSAPREAERAPPGEHLSRAFAILRALAASEGGEDAAGGSGSRVGMGAGVGLVSASSTGSTGTSREGVFAKIVQAALDAAEAPLPPKVGVEESPELASKRAPESSPQRAPKSSPQREPKVVAAESPPAALVSSPPRVPRSAMPSTAMPSTAIPSRLPGRRVPRPRRRIRRRRPSRSARYTPTTSRSPPRRYSARTSRISRRRRYRLDLGARWTPFEPPARGDVFSTRTARTANGSTVTMTRVAGRIVGLFDSAWRRARLPRGFAARKSPGRGGPARLRRRR